jgi:hypothetical protein
MAKKRPLPDFRAVRRKLDPEAFAISEGVDVDPTDLYQDSQIMTGRPTRGLRWT